MSLQITRPDSNTWEIDGHIVLQIVPNSTYDGFQGAYVLDNYWTLNTYHEETVRTFLQCLTEATIELRAQNAIEEHISLQFEEAENGYRFGG